MKAAGPAGGTMLEDRNQEDGVTRPLLQGPEGGKPEQPEPQLLQHVQKSHEWVSN